MRYLVEIKNIEIKVLQVQDKNYMAILIWNEEEVKKTQDLMGTQVNHLAMLLQTKGHHLPHLALAHYTLQRLELQKTIICFVVI